MTFAGAANAEHRSVNRAHVGGWWGGTITKVALYPYQFSCWNIGDPNRVKTQNVDLGDKDYRACMLAALTAIAAKVDPTGGCCHYHSRDMPVFPRWAADRSYISIGNHLFYRGIK